MPLLPRLSSSFVDCAARVLLIFAWVGFASTALAQRATTSMSLAGSRVTYADSVGVSALTLSPAIELDRHDLAAGASASFSQLARGGWTAQGLGIGSVFTPPMGSFTGELAASLGGSTHQDRTRTAHSIITARGHLMSTQRGAWLGLGGGGTWDGFSWRRVAQAEGGVWARVAETGSVMATVTPTVVDDTNSYTDADIAARFDGRIMELTALLGTRTGAASRAMSNVRTWGSLSVAAWITNRIAVVGSGGTYAADPTRGFPDGRFITLGVRLGERQRRIAIEALPTAATRESSSPETGGIDRFELVAGGGRQRTIRVLAPTARTVELGADFTAWDAVRLVQGTGGWWTITLPIAPGTWQLNVRMDGGPWLVPPSLARLKDEFGGEVGLLVVR